MVSGGRLCAAWAYRKAELMCKESEKKQTSKVELPDYIKQGGQLLVNKATDLTNTPYQAYTGDRVAGLTGDQQTMFQKVRDLVGNAPDLTNESLQGVRNYSSAPAGQISQSIVDESGPLGSIQSYMNPYLDQTLQPAIKKLMDTVAQQRNQIGAQATSAGAFGDARHGIVESELNKSAQENVGNLTSQAYSQAFDRAMGLRGDDINRQAQNVQFNEQALNRQLTGAQALPSVQSSNQSNLLQQLNALLSSGTVQQAQEQSQLDANYQDFLRQYGHQFDVLGALGSALTGAPYEKTQTTVEKGPDNSILGLLGSVAGAYMGMPASPKK